ncbi:RNA-binding S4 domain-containing protein [Tanacetum coccineum]
MIESENHSPRHLPGARHQHGIDLMILEVHTAECLNMSFGGFGEVEDQHADLYGVLKLGNLGFQPCSHGNFLGSILGTGIVRDKIGDILLQDYGFDGCPMILLEGLSKNEFGPWKELCGERIKDAHGHPYIIGREGCPVFFKRSGE